MDLDFKADNCVFQQNMKISNDFMLFTTSINLLFLLASCLVI